MTVKISKKIWEPKSHTTKVSMLETIRIRILKERNKAKYGRRIYSDKAQVLQDEPLLRNWSSSTRSNDKAQVLQNEPLLRNWSSSTRANKQSIDEEQQKHHVLFNNICPQQENTLSFPIEVDSKAQYNLIDHDANHITAIDNSIMKENVEISYNEKMILNASDMRNLTHNIHTIRHEALYVQERIIETNSSSRSLCCHEKKTGAEMVVSSHNIVEIENDIEVYLADNVKTTEYTTRSKGTITIIGVSHENERQVTGWGGTMDSLKGDGDGNNVFNTSCENQEDYSISITPCHWENLNMVGIEDFFVFSQEESSCRHESHINESFKPIWDETKNLAGNDVDGSNFINKSHVVESPKHLRRNVTIQIDSNGESPREDETKAKCKMYNHETSISPCIECVNTMHSIEVESDSKSVVENDLGEDCSMEKACVIEKKSSIITMPCHLFNAVCIFLCYSLQPILKMRSLKNFDHHPIINVDQFLDMDGELSMAIASHRKKQLKRKHRIVSQRRRRSCVLRSVLVFSVLMLAYSITGEWMGQSEHEMSQGPRNLLLLANNRFTN